MTKIFKKSLAFMLTAAMTMSVFVGCLTANAETAAPAVTAGNVEGKAGESVSIPISFTDISAVCAAKAVITLGDGLTATGVEENDYFQACNSEGEDGNVLISESGKKITFVDFFNWENDGLAMTSAEFNLTATISSDAEVGTDIAVTPSFIDAANYDEEGIEITKNPGKVTVITDAVVETWDDGVVTKQPTKTEVGVMTYTSNLNNTKTEDIPVPTLVEGTYIIPDIILAESVGAKMTINKKGILAKEYTDYIFSIDYKKYAYGYVLENKNITKTSDLRDKTNTAGTIDYFYFNEPALYEMGLDYTVTVYMMNDKGVVTGYSDITTSVTAQALAYAKKYSTDTKLITALVDMVNFGDATQNFFASTNPGTDIATAKLPSVGFEEYQSYASAESSLPSSFNNTKVLTKDLASTTLNVAGNVNIASSIVPKFTLLTTGYDADKLNIIVSYKNAYETEVKAEIPCNTLTSKTSGTKVMYDCLFSKLALYDLDETVKVELVYNDVKEATYEYSVGNFVNANITNSSLKDVLTKMELFSISAKAKLVG